MDYAIFTLNVQLHQMVLLDIASLARGVFGILRDFGSWSISIVYDKCQGKKDVFCGGFCYVSIGIGVGKLQLVQNSVNSYIGPPNPPQDEASLQHSPHLPINNHGLLHNKLDLRPVLNPPKQFLPWPALHLDFHNNSLTIYPTGKFTDNSRS